ncbi:RNA polymerase sigma factor [Algoriphagus resistens]|uniref:RNA polymerase sigma factor n=1 Tax=Algoriphagus resistens TaxID=1750590 RepID=UPI000716919D|nr:sigma-70 family RNA polymerase sigma factor [Algoriphagus resistens]
MNNNPKKQPETTFISSKHLEIIKVFDKKSDYDIWNAFDKGDEMAFNYIYRTYVKDLFRFSSQYSRDSYLVKDSIQNLFIYLRKKRGSLSKVNNIKGYLFKSIQREIIKNLKTEASVETLEDNIFENHFLIEVSPEVSIIKREVETELKQKVQRGLNQLTTKQRKVILLFYVEELSYKEIANIMNFSEVKTARKIVYRALATLKELIKPTSY